MTPNEREMLHEMAALIKALQPTGISSDGTDVGVIAEKIAALDDVVRSEAETAALYEQYGSDHRG